MKLGKIMVIDGDVGFLEEIKNFLSGRGCRVIALTSGLGAVEKALSERPDIILVELLPGPRGGLSVGERLKRTAGISGTPVIYLTGYYSVAREHPEVDICFKSQFDPGRLIAEIEELLKGF